MALMRRIRLIKPITFPVTTMALVHNNKEYLETYKDIIIGKKVKLNNIKMPDHFQEGWPRIEKIISGVICDFGNL